MLQDSQGFLWIGTQDGLNRFDGYNFTVFKNDPDDANSISLNSVLALHEDVDGTLWVGTWGGGLNHFDPRSNLWTRYRYAPDDPTGLCGDVVTDLLADSRGILWIATNDGGLCTLDRATGVFVRYQHDPQNANSLASNAVSTIYEVKDRTLWIGTGGFGIPGAGLERLDVAAGVFTHYRHDPVDPTSPSSDTISSILEDRDGIDAARREQFLLQGGGRQPGGSGHATGAGRPE